MVDTIGTGRSASRRQVLRLLAVGGAAGLAWGVSGVTRRGVGRVVRSRVLMGTTVALTVVDRDRELATAAADAALERMADLEALLSRFRPDSEVGRLNATGRVERPSRALRDVLGLARHVAELGDGRFDVTVQPLLDLYRDRAGRRLPGLPGDAAVEQARELVGYRQLRIGRDEVSLPGGRRITLDGIGKGYVVDRGVDALRDHGFPNVLVEAGGDLVAAGDRGVGEPWRIGIRAPRSGLALQARFDARDRAVATSGDSVQAFSADHAHHHIVDPRTGYSSPELASSTVIAPDAATADALATLTMVLGPTRGRALVEELPDCEGYFVSKHMNVTRTSGFDLA